MYQIPQTQISFRVNEEERNELQALCTQLEQKQGKEFTNAKQLVFALIQQLTVAESWLNSDENKTDSDETKTETNENELNSSENNSENEVKALIDEARIAIGYEDQDIPNDEAVLRDLIEIIKTPIDPVEKEVIKEVEKEVERKLNENEILLDLTPQQTQVLELIARWRYSKRIDESKKTRADIIKSMTFNKGSLLNYSGFFKTGIKPKNLR